MTTIPRATVEEIVAAFRQLQGLEAQRAGTLAEMLRACISKLQCDHTDTAAYRRAHTQLDRSRAMSSHNKDQAKAWLYLQYVATMLENMSGRPDAFIEGPHDVHGCEKLSRVTECL